MTTIAVTPVAEFSSRQHTSSIASINDEESVELSDVCKSTDSPSVANCIKKVIGDFFKQNFINFKNRNEFETDLRTWEDILKAVESLYYLRQRGTRRNNITAHTVEERVHKFVRISYKTDKEAATTKPVLITVRRYAPSTLVSFFKICFYQQRSRKGVDESIELKSNNSKFDEFPGFAETDPQLSFLYANETLKGEESTKPEKGDEPVIEIRTTTTTMTTTTTTEIPTDFVSKETPPFVSCKQFNEVCQLVYKQNELLDYLVSHMKKQGKEIQHLQVLSLSIPYEGAFSSANCEMYL